MVCLSIVVTENSDEEVKRKTGLLSSLGRLVSTVIEIIQTRLELIANEIEEARVRVQDVLLFGLLTLFFACMSILLLTAWVVIYFWETYRLAAVGGVAAVYIAAGLITGRVLWRRLHGHPRLFSATLNELSKDQRQLRGQDK